MSYCIIIVQKLLHLRRQDAIVPPDGGRGWTASLASERETQLNFIYANSHLKLTDISLRTPLPRDGEHEEDGEDGEVAAIGY